MLEIPFLSPLFTPPHSEIMDTDVYLYAKSVKVSAKIFSGQRKAGKYADGLV